MHPHSFALGPQAVGIPFEAKNKYMVAPLPAGKHAARDPEDPGRWQPRWTELEGLQQQEIMRVHEESSL